MSNDEEMAVIGRMVTERKALQQKQAAISHEIRVIGDGLTELAPRVIAMSAGYNPPHSLNDDQKALLNGTTLADLLGDLNRVTDSLNVLNEKLKQAGL